MNPITWIERRLDAGWFSRILVGVQIWLAWDLLVWSQAFASTALATSKDLMGAAATVGAVAAAPLGLVTLAVNKYMELRSTRPLVLQDRRSNGSGSASA
jgi:hypothetical protein